VPALELGEDPKSTLLPGTAPAASSKAPPAGELLELPDPVSEPAGRAPGRPLELLPSETDGPAVNWALILGVGGLLAMVLLVVSLTMAALFIPRLTEKSAAPPPSDPEETQTTRPRPARPPMVGPMAIPIGGAVVGRPAPEIEGEDLDGKRFKLSEYHGKVVVLVFWADTSAASREAYAFQRRLVQRRDGQPFVLLGVNRDQDREHAKQVVRNDNLTWRSWWDGGQRGGLIGRIWGIKELPTTYVLDPKGVIRFKTEGSPPEAEVDRIIDDLLRGVPR
jgi:peroxiredoxin